MVSERQVAALGPIWAQNDPTDIYIYIYIFGTNGQTSYEITKTI